MKIYLPKICLFFSIVFSFYLTQVFAQELNEKQLASHSLAAEVVSLPISVVKGVGIFSDIELRLTFSDGKFELLDFTTTVDYLITSYGLRTATSPNLCLEGAALGTTSFINNGGCGFFTGEQWRFVERPDFPNEDNFFWLINRSSASECLTDEGSGTSRKINVQACNVDDNRQLWKLMPAVNGFYYIVPRSVNGIFECLDGAASDTGSPAVTTCDKTSGQMWLIKPVSENPSFLGKWNTNFGSMFISQKGGIITGTYAEPGFTAGQVTGTVSAVTATSDRVDGTWTRFGTSGSFKWVVAEDNSHWRGNFDGNEWCGWRDGETEPDPCLLIP